MKQIHWVVGLLVALLATSCGPQMANDATVKSWVLRQCIDDDYQQSMLDDFMSQVAQGKIKVDGIRRKDRKEYAAFQSVYNGMDASDRNAVATVKEAFEQHADASAAFSSIVFFERLTGMDFPKGDLDEYTEYLSELFYASVVEGNLNETITQNMMSGLLDESNKEKYAKLMASIALGGGSEIEFNLNLLESCGGKMKQGGTEEAWEVISGLAEAFFQYMEDYADEEVSILDWNYDEGATGIAYTGYLVEYEVESGYYVLLSLKEFDDDRYTQEIIYGGDSLDELLEYYE